MYSNRKEQNPISKTPAMFFYLKAQNARERALQVLLPAMVDDNLPLVESILKSNPELLWAKPVEEGIQKFQSRYSFRSFSFKFFYVLYL